MTTDDKKSEQKTIEEVLNQYDILIKTCEEALSEIDYLHKEIDLLKKKIDE